MGVGEQNTHSVKPEQKTNLARSIWRRRKSGRLPLHVFALMKSLLPGRVDGLVCVLIVLTGLLSAVAWTWPEEPPAYGNSSIYFVYFAEAISLMTLGLFSLLGAWIVFSDGSVWKRFFVGMALSLIPSLVFVFNFAQAWPSAAGIPSAFASQLLLVCAQRSLLVSVFLFVGLTIQSMTKWRIFLQRHPEDRPRQQPFSILQLIVITGCLAMGIAAFRDVSLMINTEIYVNEWDFVSTFGLIEFAVTMIFLVIPILICFAAQWLRRCFPLWIVLMGVTATGFGMYATVKEGVAFVLAAGIAYFVTLTAGIVMAHRWGFRLGHLNREELWTANRPTKNHGWSGWAAVVVFLVFASAIGSTVDLRALSYAAHCTAQDITPARMWQFGRIVKSINRIVGRRQSHQWYGVYNDGTIPSAGWKYDEGWPTRGLHVFCGWASFQVVIPVDQDRVIESLAGTGITDLSIVVPKLEQKVLKAMAQHDEMTLLRIEAPEIDERAFDVFCRACKVQNVVFRCTPSTAVLRSLARVDGLERVLIESAISLPSHEAASLSLLPVQELEASFSESTALELDGFADLYSLTVHASPIDEQFVDKINRLVAEHGTMRHLSLQDCKLTEETIRALARIDVEGLEINGVEADSAAINWLELAGNKRLKSLWLQGPLSESHFLFDELNRARLNVAAGRELVSSYYHDDDSRYPPLQSMLGNRISVTAEEILKEVAHRYEDDELGRLTFVDLNWMTANRYVYETLAGIESLRGIRMGNPFTPDEWEEKDSAAIEVLWERDNWEVIEFPCSGPVTDNLMAKIGKLPNLKRLVLPITGQVPKPDAVPFPVEFLDPDDPSLPFAQLLPASHSVDVSQYGNYDPADYLSANGIEQLAGAEQLESLVLPGSLLMNRTIEVFKSMPKLTKLHLVFSVADPSQLSQLVGIHRLEELTVGISSELLAEAPEVLQEFANLRLLQLFVYDNTMHQDDQAKNQFAEILRTSLPQAEIHVIAFPSLEF